MCVGGNATLPKFNFRHEMDEDELDFWSVAQEIPFLWSYLIYFSYSLPSPRKSYDTNKNNNMKPTPWSAALQSTNLLAEAPMLLPTPKPEEESNSPPDDELPDDVVRNNVLNEPVDDSLAGLIADLHIQMEKTKEMCRQLTEAHNIIRSAHSFYTSLVCNITAYSYYFQILLNTA